MVLLSSQVNPLPQVDLTITISVILGCAAVISPVLVAIINGIIQYKMKKLELRQEAYSRNVLRKQKMLENFICAFSASVTCEGESSLRDFGKYYPFAYMMSSDDARKHLELVHFHVLHKNWDEARKYVDVISADIHKTIMELQPTKR